MDMSGCEVNPVPMGCFSCPLPECIWGERDPWGKTLMDREALRVAVLADLRSGYGVKDAARRNGTRWRNAYRIRSERREGTGG